VYSNSGQNFVERTSYGSRDTRRFLIASNMYICEHKHLHSAWVADAASFCSSCVRTTCTYFHVFQFFPWYIYFWLHAVKTAPDKTVGREITLFMWYAKYFCQFFF